MNDKYISYLETMIKHYRDKYYDYSSEYPFRTEDEDELKAMECFGVAEGLNMALRWYKQMSKN